VRAKKLTLTTRVDALVPDRARGDLGRLRQVLTNLVGNALKFTEEGEVEVRVTREDPADPGHLRFVVRDTGIGIAPDARPRLFQPFSQADGSTTRRYGGTGLGLVICRRLVTLMGGAIGVDSEARRGSTFWFTARLAPPSALPSKAPSAMPGAYDAAGALVLVADDNSVNQRVIERLLAKRGLRVDVVGNGLEAVAAAARRPYDLVLMDCQMPEMDGYEATRKLRAEGARLPIVAMTANALTGDRERCLDAGMDDYLTKPLTAATLDGTLTRWLSRGLDAEPG
jgi:CheY-like chemotaxis protein